MRPRGLVAAPSCGRGGSQLSCVVCGGNGRLSRVTAKKVKSMPTVVEFLCRHRVISEERIAAWVVPHICQGCNRLVNRCDEFFWAFTGELNKLHDRAGSYDGRITDPLEVCANEVQQLDDQMALPCDGRSTLAEEGTENNNSADLNDGPCLVMITEDTKEGIILNPEASDCDPVHGPSQGTSTGPLESAFGRTVSSANQEACGGNLSDITVKTECNLSGETEPDVEFQSSNDEEEEEQGNEGEEEEKDLRSRNSGRLLRPRRPAKKWNTKTEGPQRVCAECGVLVEVGKNAEHYRLAHPGVKLKNLLLADFLECEQCSYKTRRKADLMNHEKQKHYIVRREAAGVGVGGGTAKVHRCPESPQRVFKSKETLETHLHKAHGKPLSVPCPQCDKAFVTASRMKAHHDLVHATSTKTKVCEHCGDQVLEHRYRSHFDNRHRPKPKVFTCEICGETRGTNKRMKIHLKRDHGVGDYKLPENKKRECPECGKQISNKEYFFVHLFKMHGIEEPELAPFKRTCELCGKVLAGRSEIEGHARLHSGERYVCPTCGYKTRFLGNFTKHRKTAHGYVPLDPKHCRNTSAPGFQLAAAPHLKKPEQMQTDD